MQRKIILLLILLLTLHSGTIFSVVPGHVSSKDIPRNSGNGINENSDSLVNKLHQLIHTADSLHDYPSLSELHTDLSLLYEQMHDYKSAFDNIYYAQYYEDSAWIEVQNERIEVAQKKYDMQATKSQLEFLNKTNWMQEQKIRNHNYLLFGIFVSIAVVVLIAILIFQNNAIKTRNKVAEIAQMNLRQQLNPEFIFNTLNEIQYSLFLNDRGVSHKILSKFAKLMRCILDNSQHPVIPIKNEIEAIHLFLELEKLKHQDSFFFHIKMDKLLDALDDTIPPWVIYPFVENLIERIHNENKTLVNLYLDFSLFNKKLLCAITESAVYNNPDKIPGEVKLFNDSTISLITSVHPHAKLKQYDQVIKNQTEGILRSEIFIPLQNRRT